MLESLINYFQKEIDDKKMFSSLRSSKSKKIAKQAICKEILKELKASKNSRTSLITIANNVEQAHIKNGSYDENFKVFLSTGKVQKCKDFFDSMKGNAEKPPNLFPDSSNLPKISNMNYLE